jgi:YVTN family beta-propeller protein
MTERAMTAPRLLVPLAVTAFVVNKDVWNAHTYTFWRMQYERLQHDFSPPMPEPSFSPAEDQGYLQDGVHLHWILPDALTHGVRHAPLFSVRSDVQALADALDSEQLPPVLARQFENRQLAMPEGRVTVQVDTPGRQWLIVDWVGGQRFTVTREPNLDQIVVQDANISFPLVPNRWLVVRFWPDAALDDPRRATAWVLESDYVLPEQQRAGDERYAPFVNPFPTRPDMLEPTTIGRATALDEWPGEVATPGRLFLRAIGPGDPTFAAWVPGLQNVFAFHDTVKDLPGTATLTYLVAGWYSDPAADPLAGAKASSWSALLQDLAWTAGKADPPPQQCLFHGMIHSVAWPPDAGEGDEHTPRSVAVGNTAIDALAALIASQDPGADAQLFEAFQYNLLDTLDQPGGEVALGQQIHQAWFGARPGGTIWEIVSRPREDTKTPQAEPAVPPELAAQLADLNVAQNELDHSRRTLASLQHELYALWWKCGYVSAPGFESKVDGLDTIRAALDLARPGSLARQVQAQQTTVAGKAALVADLRRALKLPDDLILKAQAAPRFWHPNDPVVLIAGLGKATLPEPSDRGAKQGQLLCRLPEEAIGELVVGGLPLTADKLRAEIAIVSSPHIPAQVGDLCAEVFFLDPANITRIAKLAGVDPSAAIQAVQALLDPNGPARIAPLAAQRWQQAWLPLYLEWQVTWRPTVRPNEVKQWAFDRRGWRFDGQDYVYTNDMTDLAPAIILKGRTFLTPQVAGNFEARLEQYLAQHPDPKLRELKDDLVALLQKWDVISQALSGFTDQLATISIEQSWPPGMQPQPKEGMQPVPNVAELIGEQYLGVPVADAGATDENPFFFPLRAGFLRFENMWIVDRFGRVLRPLGDEPSAYVPVHGRGLLPDSHLATDWQTWIKLAPRIAQPSRLDFRLVSADADACEVGLATEATPVCGWLLPNHLDNGLTIYDAHGSILGELLLLKQASTTGVTFSTLWQPAPGAAPAAPTPQQIANAHLRRFVTDLAGHPDSGTAFQNFLQAIDETLWTVDPLGGFGDQDLAVLIGRPLALVRARLRLTLDGDPLYDQSWQNTLQQVDGRLTDIPFPARLGSLELRDDGLLGYFLGDNYRQCYTLHQPDAALASPPYLKLAGAAGNIQLLCDGRTTAFVTMLLDPRGGVHASTGILPTKRIGLPAKYVDGALGAMEVTFRAGPLITDPYAIRVPRPAEQNGEWSWVQRSAEHAGQWEESAIVKATQQARLPDAPLALRSGWLKLNRFAQQPASSPESLAAPEPPRIQRFEATPATLSVRGEPVTLYWHAQGADECAIEPDIGPVPPIGCRTVTPVRTTDYTLTCRGAGGTAKAQATVAVKIAMQDIAGYDQRAPAGIAISPDGAWLYVANSDSDTLSAIDTATQAIVQTIGVGKRPIAVAVSSDGRFVFVSNSVDGTLSKIATTENWAVKIIPAGQQPAGIAIAADDDHVYVASSGDGTVLAFPASFDEIDPGAKPAAIRVEMSPQGLAAANALAPLGYRTYGLQRATTLYVANYGSDTVSAIDTSGDGVTLIQTVAVGKEPSAVAVIPNSVRAYVTNRGDGTVSAIDPQADVVITVPVGRGPVAVTIAPDGGRVYVANRDDDSISAIDTATDMVVYTIPLNGRRPSGLAIGHDGARLYVANQGSDSITVVDLG